MAALMKPQEAADYLGYNRNTLSDWRYKDRGLMHMGQAPGGPVWVDGRGGKCRGYRVEDLDAWLVAQRVGV